MSKPTRPVLRYHGGKWLIAEWIISNFPDHQLYTEAFGGAASVLIRKKPAHGEVYNDLDGDVVNLFSVLRDEIGSESLIKALRLTPFSREEFQKSYELGGDAVERARKMVVRSYMGFGSAAHNPKHRTGFRANSQRSGTVPAKDWVNYPECLLVTVERLRGVTIENRDAKEVIKAHDKMDALHYVDPPYPLSTRYMGEKTNCYRFEMSDNDHRDLAAVLRSCEGMVVLSGYACDLYDQELYGDWHRVERKHLADGARERTEVLWLNESAWRQKFGQVAFAF